MRTLLTTILTLVLPLPSAAQDKAFVDAFRAAWKAGDRAEMASIVGGDQENAVEHAVALCEKISERPTPQLEEEVDALRIAYKEAFDSRFVGELYEYLSLLSPTLKRERRAARARFDAAEEKFEKAVESGRQEEFGVAAHEFEGVAALFDGYGDNYFASESWLGYAACFEEDVRGEKFMDLKKAAEGYEKAAKFRERAGLMDDQLEAARRRYEELEYQGFGDPTKGPAAREAAKREAEAEEAFPVEATFQVIEDIDEFLRPGYTADSTYQIWQSVFIQGEEGATAAFPTLEGLTVHRTAAAQAGVDDDGDGQPDAEVPMTGNITPVTVTLGEGESKRPWAFLACIGKERDIYQGFAYNLQSSARDFLMFYAAPAASMVVQVGETPLQIVDDNMDGVYGSPMRWLPRYGLIEGVFEPSVDSVRVDGADEAMPWSELMKIDDQWYRFETQAGGTKFIVTPTTVATGEIELDFKGIKPDWFIVRGAEESNANVMFDLAPGGKRGTEVPVGRYEMLFGRVSKGKRDQLAKADILPSRDVPTWVVEEGDTVEIEMGAPFQFEFEVDQSPTTATVRGKSLIVKGRGNETYQAFWNCVPQPEVLAREVGKRKGSKEGKMRPAGSQEEIISKENDLAYAWVPYDFEVQKRNEGDVLELALEEKKNKLFGKIESDWKQ